MNYIAACYKKSGQLINIYLTQFRFAITLSSFVFTPLVSYAGSLENFNSSEIHVLPHETQEDLQYSSLQKAIDFSYNNLSPNVTSVKFVIHQGTYDGQSAVLRPKQGVHYEITSASGSDPLPSFDGHQQQLTWLKIVSTNGSGSTVSISKLRITNYVTAISIEGDRENLDKFNSGNKISDMRFENIGQNSPDASPSTAVIRLVNSRANEILNNVFLNIRNVKDCNLLHSIYLAHHSSDNSIKNNSFANFCGSPIRVRDDSNRNIAKLNSFVNIQNKRLMDQWFCDKNIREDCTKKQPEQDSHSNIFKMNEISP
ncbi:hypothetical protein [Pseudomonas violetae]|uniref:Right handed beta helix domain-containing protein n=1 Tax=Pseudomonas violetae TaxID=2915813 RepID=A0ABT0F7U4_9PSED|nr:hypothetical protein [Pseudomonas violetae]MCK1793689.1 hypothetical protein [Pseudomonas violetae]